MTPEETEAMHERVTRYNNSTLPKRKGRINIRPLDEGMELLALRKRVEELEAQAAGEVAPMTADEYQQQASRTLIDTPDAEYSPEELMLVWNALGLAGEAGEVAEVIKKSVFHRHALDRDKLIKELGDVCWYMAALCSKLGIPLSEVMERNIAKLKTRFPDGWSSEASKARVDTK